MPRLTSDDREVKNFRRAINTSEYDAGKILDRCPELLKEISKDGILSEFRIDALVENGETWQVKLLIERGVKFDLASERSLGENSTLLKSYKKDNPATLNTFIYLLRHLLKEVDGDFYKLKIFDSSNNDIFSFIRSKIESRDLFLILNEFPELKKPLPISSIFFHSSREKVSKSISSAASFDPVNALDGDGFQVSVLPSEKLEKRKVIIDHSFLDDSPRQVKQIRRLIAEGFTVMILNGKNSFLKLEADFDENVLKAAKDFPFTKSHYEDLKRDFSLSFDETILLDGSRKEELKSLFLSPIFQECLILNIKTPNNPILTPVAYLDQIESLDENDPYRILRNSKDEDLSDAEVARIMSLFKEKWVIYNELFQHAVLFANVKIVKAIMEEGVELDIINHSLTSVVRLGRTEIVEILLAQGADVNCKDFYGYTPLIWAVLNGHTEIAKLLLENEKVEVDYKGSNGCTPLLWAVSNGHNEIVKLLLESEKVDVDYKDSNGCTPLIFAAQNGHAEIVKLLLESEKVDVDHKNSNGFTPLLWAALSGYTEIVEILLESKKVDVDCKDSNGNTPLIFAVQNGHTKIVKLLLESTKVDVDYKGSSEFTPLIWAALSGHTEIVKLLLESKKVDVDYKDSNGNTPLLWAALSGHTEIAKLLLAEGADVNSKNSHKSTPLIFAAERGHAEIVKLLLESKKVDVDCKDSNGNTPLIFAVQNGHTKIVKLLLESTKVDVDYKGSSGFTPLIFAVQNGHAEIVKLLLESKKVEVDYKDSNGFTPLLWAALSGHTEIAKLLLAQGADVNSKNSHKSTPLIFAAERGHTEIVKLLLQKLNEKHIDKTQHKQMELALSLTLNKGHIQTAQALMRAGVDASKASKIRISVDRVSNGFLSSSSGNQDFNMAEAGEIINLDKLEKPIPYPIRIRVAVVSLNQSSFVKTIADKSKQQILSSDKITQLQQDFSEKQKSFKEDKTRANVSFIASAKKGKATKLLSVNYPANIVGVKVPEGVKILELFKDEFGFYNIRTSRPCNLEYVLEVDFDKVKALEGQDQLKKIIDEYIGRNKSAQDKKLPSKKILQSTDDFLKQVFESGGGPCALRTAAFLHHLKKDHPELFTKCRAINIDRNHAAIEVKTEDGPNDFTYVDLGGASATLKQLSGNYTNYDNFATRALQTLVNFVDRHPAARKTITALAFPFVASAKAIGKLFGKKAIVPNVSESAETTSHSTTDQNAPETAETTLSSAKTSPFRSFLLEQKQSSYSKLKKENIGDLFGAEKLPSLIITKKDRASLCINTMIREARKSDLAGLHHRPIFYIDSIKQIDIFKKAVKIKKGAGGKSADAEFNAAIEQDGLLADFLRDSEAYNASPDSANRPPLLIINWSNFTPRQRVALNTMLDEKPSVQGADLSQVKVISVCDHKIDDESFVSRHAKKYQEDLDLKDPEMPQFSQADHVAEIDLRGVSDWKKQLFGRISVKGDCIGWTKSEFVELLERGGARDLNISISNCSNNSELKEFLALSQSLGYFFYHGKIIPIQENLKINLGQRNFNFENFRASGIIARSNVDNWPDGCEIINEQIFDFLLRKKRIEKYGPPESKLGRLVEEPGLIELASQKPDKTLRLFISSNLSQAQYYLLLKEAQERQVKLELNFAKGVKFPDYLQQISIAADKLPQETERKIKARIFTSPYPRRIKIEEDLFVIDVEDCSFQDLIQKISYEVKGETFNFFEEESALIGLFKSGKNVVLRGEFSEDLMQMLQPILAEEYAKNLVLLIETKDQKSHKILNFLGENGCEEFKGELQPERKTTLSKENYQSTYANFSDASHEELMRDASRFLETRLETFHQMLTDNSSLALYGEAGIGKTFLVHTLGENLHHGLDNFNNWIEQGGALFLDESNIIDSHLTMFEALKDKKEDRNVRIFYQGKFHEITDRHKVLFAHNPLSHSGGRVKQKLFSEGGIATFEMRHLPASYIYSLLTTEIFDKSIFAKDSEARKEFLTFCKAEIIKYQDLIDSDSKEKTTIRALQESALQFLTAKIEGKDFNDVQNIDDKLATPEELRKKYPYAKEISSNNFISTKATIAVENALGKAFAVRAQQIKGSLPFSGTNGVLIEGASGIGKSALIQSYIEAEGREYYKIDSSVDFEQQKEIIIQAFEKGVILWIDEIDSCVQNGIESILNAALSGIHPRSGEKVTGKSAGFMLIASSNGITHEGRSQISPALKSRLNFIRPSDLSEYQESDIEKIVTKWVLDKKVGEKVVEKGGPKRLTEDSVNKIKELAKDYLEVQKSDEKDSANLRVLKRFAEGDMEKFELKGKTRKLPRAPNADKGKVVTSRIGAGDATPEQGGEQPSTRPRRTLPRAPRGLKRLSSVAPEKDVSQA